MEQPKNNYPSDIKSYKKIRTIGKGSFGLVYEAMIIKGPHVNEHVAIKEVTIGKLEEKSRKYLSVSFSLNIFELNIIIININYY